MMMRLASYGKIMLDCTFIAKEEKHAPGFKAVAEKSSWVNIQG